MTTNPFRVGELRLESARPGRWRMVVAIIGLAVLVGAIVEVIARHDRAALAARDALWRVDGPPCAPLDPAVFRNRERLPQATVYDDVLYRRLGGTMTCTHLVDPGGGAPRHSVCKFSALDYLAVSQAGRDQFFDLTAAHAAAVVVKDSQARCMVIPPFHM